MGRRKPCVYHSLALTGLVTFGCVPVACVITCLASGVPSKERRFEIAVFFGSAVSNRRSLKFAAQVPLLEDKPELKVASSFHSEAGILLSALIGTL